MRDAFFPDKGQKCEHGHPSIEQFALLHVSFHRIWSTNWWKSPERETKKLVDFIKSVENDNPSLFNDKSNIIDAFNDDVIIVDNNI